MLALPPTACPCCPFPPRTTVGLWAAARSLNCAAHGTSRAAAMALITRTSLLPRHAAAAGGSTYSDMLQFERSMRRFATLQAEGGQAVAICQGVVVAGWSLCCAGLLSDVSIQQLFCLFSRSASEALPTALPTTALHSIPCRRAGFCQAAEGGAAAGSCGLAAAGGRCKRSPPSPL